MLPKCVKLWVDPEARKTIYQQFVGEMRLPLRQIIEVKAINMYNAKAMAHFNTNTRVEI